MTPQEVQALETFLAQLTQARADAKDPQAEARIVDAVARQPDAAYLLVQRAMLLDHALSSAKAQIASLQNQLQAAQAGQFNSFPGNSSAWGVGGGQASPAPSFPPSAGPASVPAATQNVPAQPSRPGLLGGGWGSTLGNIATTAAGVAGGAFLFQGIENLFHRGGGSSFLGQPAMGFPAAEPTVVNNYYVDDNSGTFGQRDAGSADSFLSDGIDDGGFLDDDSSVI